MQSSPTIDLARCCGQERSSPFCPNCGKQLKTDPLLSLLAHVRLQEQQYRRRVNAIRKSQADSLLSTDQPRRAHYALSLERALAKWESWRVALEKVLRLDSD